MTLAHPAASALLQAGIRRGMIDVTQALALRHVLVKCGNNPAAVRDKLTLGDHPAAGALAALLPDESALSSLGPWRRLALLGEGGTGRTWLGLGVDGFVAIKDIHAPLSTGPGMDSIRRDLDSLIGSGHRYVVNVLAIISGDDGRISVVSDYRQGMDVRGKITSRGPLTEARMLVLVRQAAKGLHILHHAGRWHGHMHPGNMLLDADGRCALGDHGLALVPPLNALRSGWNAAALGRQAFAAPEELSGSPRPGPASDIYALGCIAYYVLTGHPPFPGTSAQQMLQHSNGPRPDVRDLAPGISELTAKTILKMMQIDPAARYVSAYQLLQSLERNFAELSVKNRSGEHASGQDDNKPGAADSFVLNEPV